MIRTTAILLSYFILGCIFSISAQSSVDSLKSLLETQSQDTNAVNLYLELYEAIKFEDRDQAAIYLDKSLELSSQLNFQNGTLNGLLAKGEYFETGSLYDSALLAYRTAQKVALDIEDNEGIKETLIGLGSVFTVIQKLKEADSVAFLCIEMAENHPLDSARLIQCYTILSNTAFFRSQYEKSIEFDLKSLSYNQKDFSKRAKSFLNIGSTHDLLGNHKKANDYYLKALEMSALANNHRMTALAHLELGTLKTNLKEFEEARKLYGLAMDHFEQVNDQAMIAFVNYSLGKILSELNEFDRAIERFKIALRLADEIDLVRSKGDYLYHLGLAYYKKKDYLKAEQYFLSSKSVFDELENTTMNARVLLRLSELYDATKDYQQAYRYLKEVKTLDDSTFAANQEVKISEIEEQYQNEQKQQEIELLSAENKIASLELNEQENLRNYLILVAFLLILLIGVVYNRYQLKVRANARLKELDALKTSFFTNISHEFRTPLTLILSPLQKLLKEEESHETKEALTIIHRNATVLTELTNQLLDLSKLEAGKLTLKVMQGDFKEFIKVLCASFGSLAVAQKVEFVTEIEDAPEEAYFDEDKVQKVLNNLLSNAFKFTSTKGRVTLKVECQDEQLSISIGDTGKGISERDKTLIFKRFYQNSNHQPNATGTGVGLTLSKELALLHNGDIEVDSEPGSGTVFTLHFPINRTAYRSDQIVDDVSETSLSIEHLKPIPYYQEEAEATTDKIILIVEDNPDLRSHMKSLLKEEYKVMESINGKVGIEDAIRSIPDIIISDLMMPEADGIELCNALKSNEKTSHIPIILLTAKADRDTKLGGLKTGADDFLTKPFDNDELMIRVQNLIVQREKLQAKYGQTLRLEPSKITVQSQEEVFIKKALEVVDQHLSNSEFTVEAFQKEMGMSRMQLHRKLRALTNFSASEFIRDIRLQRSVDLLNANGINVAEVAYSCGFNTVSYFTQCFTEKYGINPSKYIEKVS